MADTVLYQIKKQSEVYWRLWEETKDPFLLKRHKFYNAMEEIEETFNEIMLNAEKMDKDGRSSEFIQDYLYFEIMNLRIPMLERIIEDDEGE